MQNEYYNINIVKFIVKEEDKNDKLLTIPVPKPTLTDFCSNFFNSEGQLLTALLIFFINWIQRDFVLSMREELKRVRQPYDSSSSTAEVVLTR